MPKTTLIHDCQRFAAAVQNASGELPDVLQRLLSAHQLLTAPMSTAAPQTAILDAALSGKLDQKMLDKLLPAAATAAMVDKHRAELAHDSEHTLVGEWHRQLEAGAADAVLNSLRPAFDRHAEAVARARSLINPESSLEHVIETGEPELITAWRQLPEHLQAIERISAVARQFAPRLGSFSQITEYALAENVQLADSAIMCTTGSLLGDSSLFHAPDQGGRTSPWFRCGGLKLHTIAEAQRRYDDFAAAEFDRVHASRARGGHIDESGRMVEDAVPENPFRQKVST